MLRFLVFGLVLFFSVQLHAQYTADFLFKSDYFETHSTVCHHRSQLKSDYVESNSNGLWNLVYNRLEVKVDPAEQFISGSVEFIFISLVHNLNELSIDLAQNMVVDSIVSAGKSLNYQHESSRVNIRLAELEESLNIGDYGEFTVYYHGIPSASGFGAFVSKTVNDNPVLYTLSEPYGAREWWPCKQSLRDKIDSIDIVVSSPGKYRTASNGILVFDAVDGGLRINHWQHRHPIATYLVAIAVADYSIYEEKAFINNGFTVNILNYVYPESLEKAKKETANTARILEFFSDLFIPYPFANEKYGHAQFGWGGGMEHQTMSFMGGFNFDIIAHELAHQWFGDYITCGSWKEIWLNEGFATYLTFLANEHLKGSENNEWKQSATERILSQPGGSVYCKDTSDVNRVFDGRLSYQKGAYVLHMLRGQLGDEAFFQGLRNYLNDERVINGFATTGILRENLELAADTSLTEFFNDWVFGEGHPKYEYSWANTADGVDVKLVQSPSISNGLFFEMKVPIQLQRNGERKTYWLKNTQNEQLFSIATTTNVEAVLFDEDLWLLAEKQKALGIEHLVSGVDKIRCNVSDEQLSIISSQNSFATIKIYDHLGKKRMVHRWETGSDIPLHHLQSGFYLVAFMGNETNEVARFVKD